jgi:hypothetical protein
VVLSQDVAPGMLVLGLMFRELYSFNGTVAHHVFPTLKAASKQAIVHLKFISFKLAKLHPSLFNELL